jgi:hypothetical protein
MGNNKNPMNNDSLYFPQVREFTFLHKINPKTNPKNTINAHLSRFMLMPNSQHFKKQSHDFSIQVSILLNIIKSLKKIFINRSI